MTFAIAIILGLVGISMFCFGLYCMHAGRSADEKVGGAAPALLGIVAFVVAVIVGLLALIL